MVQKSARQFQQCRRVNSTQRWVVSTLFVSIIFAIGFLFSPNRVMASDINTEGFSVESLVPIFFYQGYHFAIGYRHDSFRIRASVINSGTYDAEPDGINNHRDQYSRFYKDGSAGVFFDYFPFLQGRWIKGIHVFAFFEHHLWEIEQRSTGISRSITTWDAGPGLGYQLFLTDQFYIQPAYHHYFRNATSAQFGSETYTIPTQDQSLVFRIGWQF